MNIFFNIIRILLYFQIFITNRIDNFFLFNDYVKAIVINVSLNTIVMVKNIHNDDIEEAYDEDGLNVEEFVDLADDKNLEGKEMLMVLKKTFTISPRITLKMFLAIFSTSLMKQ